MRLVAAALLLVCAGCPRGTDARARAAAPNRAEAERALAAGDYKTALAAARLAAAYEPDNPDNVDVAIRTRLAAFAAEPSAPPAETPDEMDYEARWMIKRDPPHAAVYETTRAQLALAKGDAAGAETLFRAAVAHDRDWPPATFGLAQALVSQGKSGDAIGLLEKLLATAPTYPPTAAALAPLYLSHGNAARAIDLYHQALKTHDEPALHLGLAEALMTQKDAAGSVAELQLVVDRDPSNARAHRRLGEIFFSTGALDLAAVEYQAALRSDDPEAAYGLGLVELARKHYSDAAHLFDRVAERLPRQANALYQAGTAHEMAGETAAAVERLRRYLEVAKAMPAERERVKDVEARLQRLGVSPVPVSPVP